MPPIKKQPLCEIIFGQLRIPVSDKERGKQAIEGIFMIGEPAKAEPKPRGRKRGKRKAKGVKVIARRRKRRGVSEGKASAWAMQKSKVTIKPRGDGDTLAMDIRLGR